MNADYDYLIKVICAGSSGAGKSSLLTQYVDGSFTESFVSTIGVDFKIKTIPLSNGKTVKLQIWDTAGQDRFKTIVSSYWRSADCGLFVFDLTDMASFQSVRNWAEEADRYGSPKMQRILVGNKADLTSRRVIPCEMAEELAKSMGIQYIETSAKTAANVSKTFELLAEKVTANYQELHGIGAKPDVYSSLEYKREPIIKETCCTIS